MHVFVHICIYIYIYIHISRYVKIGLNVTASQFLLTVGDVTIPEAIQTTEADFMALLLAYDLPLAACQVTTVMHEITWNAVPPTNQGHDRLLRLCVKTDVSLSLSLYK